MVADLVPLAVDTKKSGFLPTRHDGMVSARILCQQPASQCTLSYFSLNLVDCGLQPYLAPLCWHYPEKPFAFSFKPSADVHCDVLNAMIMMGPRKNPLTGRHAVDGPFLFPHLLLCTEVRNVHGGR